MKATITFPEDKHTGVEETTVTLTLEGIDTKTMLFNERKVSEFKTELGNLFSKYWDTPENIVID